MTDRILRWLIVGMFLNSIGVLVVACAVIVLAVKR